MDSELLNRIFVAVHNLPAWLTLTSEHLSLSDEEEGYLCHLDDCWTNYFSGKDRGLSRDSDVNISDVLKYGNEK